MSRNNKLVLTQVVLLVASLGVMGYLIWKVGALDVIITLVIQALLLVPFIMVIVGLMQATTYNKLNEEMSHHYNELSAKVMATVGLGDIEIDIADKE